MKRRSRRIADQTTRETCDCKVGACYICGSGCKRCMCACDGVDPFDALQRMRGGNRTRRSNRKARETEDDSRTTRRRTRSMTRSKSHTNETTSQDEKKDNKHKRKRQKHFHRVGRIEGSSRKHTRKPLSNNDTDDSDSSYQLSNYENTTDNKESSTNNTQNNNNDSSSNTVSANSTDNQSTALPEFDLYIEKEDDGDASKNWLDTTDTKEEGKTTTIAEQIELRRQSQSKYQYSKNIAEKEPNFIIKKKSKKTKDKHPKNATKTIPKQLTRAEKLEQFLSNMDIPKYWIRVIPSFLI